MTTLPAFFDDVPPITVHDPLAALLGSATDGRFSYHYIDAVKLAGHSCPVVAGAWLMVATGLSWLYGDGLPTRGGIDVALRDARDQGTTGVIAAVVSLLTGAADGAGFPGIGPNGHHARRGLMRFDVPIDGLLGLRRRDTGAGVVLDIDTRRVPPDPALRELLPEVIDASPPPPLSARFAALWQDRVRRMLLEHAGDPKLIHIYDWPAR